MSFSLGGPRLTIGNGIPDRVEMATFAKGVGSNEIVGTREFDQTVLYGVAPNVPVENHAARAKIGKGKLLEWANAHGLNVESLPALKIDSPTPLRGVDILPLAAVAEAPVTARKTKSEILRGMIEDPSPPVDEKARPLVAVVMGQGVVGRLDLHRFCSDSFDSCMPVILFNAKTRIGGLFHVPCPSLVEGEFEHSRPEIAAALREMVRLVEPTQIVVRPGAQANADHMGTVMASQIRRAAVAVKKDVAKAVVSQGVTGEVRFEDQPSAYILVAMRDGELSADGRKRLRDRCRQPQKHAAGTVCRKGAELVVFPGRRRSNRQAHGLPQEAPA
jgi:hypothetical protein